jgi:hypothetical protein
VTGSDLKTELFAALHRLRQALELGFTAAGPGADARVLTGVGSICATSRLADASTCAMSAAMNRLDLVIFASLRGGTCAQRGALPPPRRRRGRLPWCAPLAALGDDESPRWEEPFQRSPPSRGRRRLEIEDGREGTCADPTSSSLDERRSSPRRCAVIPSALPREARSARPRAGRDRASPRVRRSRRDRY